MFSRKSKITEDVATAELNQMVSRIYEFARILKVKDINLLSIGDDEFGATIQVRQHEIKSFDSINSWISRSANKVKEVSWVEVEIKGYDSESDYRSKSFKFNKHVGELFLIICNNAAINNTPIHHLLTITHLS